MTHLRKAPRLEHWESLIAAYAKSAAAAHTNTATTHKEIVAGGSDSASASTAEASSVSTAIATGTADTASAGGDAAASSASTSASAASATSAVSAASAPIDPHSVALRGIQRCILRVQRQFGLLAVTPRMRHAWVQCLVDAGMCLSSSPNILFSVYQCVIVMSLHVSNFVYVIFVLNTIQSKPRIVPTFGFFVSSLCNSFIRLIFGSQFHAFVVILSRYFGSMRARRAGDCTGRARHNVFRSGACGRRSEFRRQ